ncbi:MAG: serine hydrolase [Lysobacterales bacterium]
MIATVFLSGCQSLPVPGKSGEFEAELAKLQMQFFIPGLSVQVAHKGQVLYQSAAGCCQLGTDQPISTQTQFPVASLTKVFAAALLFQAVDESLLSLDEPLNRFLKKTPLDPTITVGHVLSHTSQGEPGAHFLYSSRFSALTTVIETVFNMPFEQALNERIVAPLSLDSSYLLPDGVEGMNAQRLANLASPHNFEGGTVDGFVDYGSSAAAGLVSTPSDLLRFFSALASGDVVSQESWAVMSKPAVTGSPYGFGLFTNVLYGQRVLWGYGQYDSYSSLMMFLPDQSLSMALVANNALVADPARLISGNLRTSLFARAFLHHFAGVDVSSKPYEADGLIADALGKAYLGRFDADRAKQSAAVIDDLLARFPNAVSEAGLGLAHALSMLKLIAHHNESRLLTDYDATAIAIGERLLAEDAYNPYAHIYLAELHDLNGNAALARRHFQAIVDASNFSPWWYTRQAQAWLDSH